MLALWCSGERDDLGDRRLDLERQLRNHSYPSQTNNSTLKLFTVFCARKGYHLASGIDKF